MEQTTNEAVAENKGGKRLAGGFGRKPLLVLGIVLAVLIITYVGLCAYAGSLDTFYPNQHINGIDVGGLTVDEAQAKLETDLLAQEIILTEPEAGISTTLTVADLGYTPEDFAGDAQYWMENREWYSFPEKGWAYLAFLTGRWPGGANWPDQDAAQFNATIDRLTEELSQAPVDSGYTILDNTIEITKARDGRTVDKAALRALLEPIKLYHSGYQMEFSFSPVPAKVLTAQEIYDAVAGEMKNAGYDAATDSIIPEQLGAEFDAAAAQSALDKADPGETVTIDAVIERPRVSAEQLKGVLFRDVLGECTTKVGGTAARIANVKLSAAAFNGLVMNSGDMISYNETTGQRTAAKGYQAAPAYVQGETVDEIGGGVCQTSSTLYLACLRSNLEITERYAHRYVPSYIPWGMDATVSWGGPDYKFTNDTDYPIRIVTSYANGYLTIRILGTNADGTSVKMTNESLSETPFEVIYEDDPTLPPGTEKVKTTPYTGHKVRTFRSVYSADGKLISRNQEAVSNYKSRNKVILRGPALPAVEPKPPVVEVPVDVPADAPAEIPVEPPAAPETETPPFIVVVPEEPGEPEL